MLVCYISPIIYFSIISDSWSNCWTSPICHHCLLLSWTTTNSYCLCNNTVDFYISDQCLHLLWYGLENDFIDHIMSFFIFFHRTFLLISFQFSSVSYGICCSIRLYFDDHIRCIHEIEVFFGKSKKNFYYLFLFY